MSTGCVGWMLGSQLTSTPGLWQNGPRFPASVVAANISRRHSLSTKHHHPFVTQDSPTRKDDYRAQKHRRRSSRMKTKDCEAALQTLITANHILHHQKVLDAYGHVSFRHPDNPEVFVMSGDRAPALVASSADLIEYRVVDSSPVDPNARKGYQERFIHSEIYKQFSDVNSVIHSHSEAVLPFTMSGVAMQPAFHIAGFLGTEVPLYDITDLYQPEDQQDMLVNTPKFGASLAATFSTSQPSGRDSHSVVLMANHGFTAVGTSIKQAVYRAVYTHINAGIQSNAIILRNAQLSLQSGVSETKIRYLNEKQTMGSQKMNDASQDRPWGLWAREVEVSPMYVNRDASR